MMIVMGSDHAGVELKKYLREHLLNLGYEVMDVGTYTEDSCNYAEFGIKAAKKVANNEAVYGVVCCGSGIGISIAANKVRGIRCANVFCNEHARLTRLHNNANMIAFGARFIEKEQAKEMLDIFLNTEFEGGRHSQRVATLDEYKD